MITGMRVWIVLTGERNEGGSISGVYLNYGSARRRVSEVISGTNYMSVRDRADCWEDGIDRVWIELRDVEILKEYGVEP